MKSKEQASTYKNININSLITTEVIICLRLEIKAKEWK